MARRGGLGRGLDSLIPNKNSGKKISDSSEKSAKRKNIERNAASSADAENGVEEKAEDNINALQDDEKKAVGSKKSGSNKAEAAEINPDEADKTAEKGGVLSKKKHVSETSRETSASEIAAEREGDSNTQENSFLKLSEAKTKTVQSASETEKPAEQKSQAGEAVINMRLSRVEPNRDQPRKYFDDDAIGELADSIRQFGVIQPLLVQEKDGYYEIIAGERRWRAAKLAGLKEVPVIVKNFSSQEAVEISLIENIQREDLNPIEEAKAYERLVSEFGLSQEAVAGRVSKSRSAVANSMRLLRLDESIQKMVEEGLISEGHARALLSLSDPAKQKEAAERIVKEKLSVRQTEKFVRELTSSRTRQQKERDVRREAILQSLSESLKNSLKTKVTIKDSGRHKGKIEIEYYSDEELERLTDILKV